jgi:hypothetical protein
MKDITPERLVKLIENAMHNADIRQALTRMKDRIAAESGMEAAVELIEAAGRLGPSDGSRCRGNGGWAKEATQPLNLSPDADDR